MNQKELIAFVKKIAEMELCSDPHLKHKCASDSGPYCASHTPAEWMEDDVMEARRLLKTMEVAK